MKSYEVVWRGPVKRASGLGIASRSYIRALRSQGVSVHIGAALMSKRNKGEIRKKRVLLYHQLPSHIDFKKERATFNPIILTTVWETTRIPKRWLRSINKFDAVCVPSKQNKQAMRQSGVKVPLFIVPHGVDTRAYTPKNKKLSIPHSKGKFVFVSVFGFQHRKNPETLLRAYWEEFSSSDNVLLVIKTNGYASYENEKWIKNTIQRYKKRLGIQKKTAPIVIIGRKLSASQLKGVYTLGSVFVLPTRGEGVGLPFLESLASGVPVITTGWGGQMDFLTRKNAFLIPYQLKNPSASMNSKYAISRNFRYLFAENGQQWAEPDRGSLRRVMRYAYQNPLLCKQKGRQGRRDVLRLSWNRAGRSLKHAIEQTMKAKKQRK